MLLYLRADLFKASPVEKVPVEERASGAPRRKGEAFTPAEASAPKHKPAVEGKPEGFKPGAIHAPGTPVERHASVGKYEPGRAEGIPESHMRIRPKGKRTTGAKTTGEEIGHKQSAWNKPGYTCAGKTSEGEKCGARVLPPRHTAVPTEHELGAHLFDEQGKPTGAQWTGTHGGMHHVEHPPKIASKVTGFRPAAIPHGSITSEHVDRKLCPSCLSRAKHKDILATAVGKTPEEAKSKAEALAEKTNKSMYMLDQMMFLAKAVPEGEGFGKPAETVSEEVSHLMKEKDYPQKRAVAAALSMQRRGDIKKDKAEKSLYLAL